MNDATPIRPAAAAELGASGAHLDPERVDIAYNGITVARAGVATPHDEDALEHAMGERDIEIACDLHDGMGHEIGRAHV